MLVALIVLLAAVVLLGLVLLRDSQRRRRELHERLAALPRLAKRIHPP